MLRTAACTALHIQAWDEETPMKSYKTALFAAAMTMVAGGASAQCLQPVVKSVMRISGGANFFGSKSGVNTRMRANAAAHEDYSGAWLDESSVRVKRRDPQSVGRRSELR